MVFIGERCLKLHRITLTLLGLWPYQKLFIWRIQAFVFFVIYGASLFFQLRPFLTTTCDIRCIFKRVSYISVCAVYMINYYSFYFNSAAVKQLLEHVRWDWKIFGNINTMNIFERYLFESYIFTYVAYISFLLGGLIFILIELKPIILDALLPMNESRPRTIEVDFDCFMDKEQYFVLYIIQEIIGIGTGIGTIITTGTLLITIGKYCCATYKIASNLIQNTVTVHVLELPDCQRIQFMHRSIYLSVCVHRRTFHYKKVFSSYWRFVKSVTPAFDLWYFPLLVIGVVSLSCVLFRLYNSIVQYDNVYDVFVSSVMLYCYLIYMFVANFLAQSYTDHSAGVVESAYNTLWYVAPVPIQKLLLIVQTCIKKHEIVLAGFFVPSIEGLSTLMTSSISYFTVMHAMHLY